VYEAQGDLQYLLGELDEAIRLFKEAIESTVYVDAMALARLHRKLAEVLSRKGEYDDALACLARGRDLLVDIDSATDESARLVVGYGTVLLALGRHDDAILEAQITLDRLSETSPNPRIVADLHDLIGKAHFFKGEFARSLDEFQSALRLREGCSDQQGVIKSLSNLAVVYGEQNRYVEALQANQAALDIAECIGDEVALATLYMNMAADYIDQGVYERAIDFNIRALKLGESMGNVYQLAIGHHNLGDLYRRIEHFDLSADHLKRAIEFAKQASYHNGVIRSMETLAKVYLAQGHVEDALASCLKSLRLAEQTGSQLWQPAILHLLGRIHHLLHRRDEARTHFAEACQIWRKREAWLDLANALLSWAKMEQDDGQVNRALELCVEAATLADRHRADDLMKQTSALLFELRSTAK